jgi:Amt family ammonium transporter
VTFLLAWLVRATIGFRVAPEIEASGIDEAEHAESAYDLSLLGSSGRAGLGTATSGLHATGSAAREEL